MSTRRIEATLSLSLGGWRDGLKMLLVTRGDGGMEGIPPSLHTAMKLQRHLAWACSSLLVGHWWVTSAPTGTGTHTYTLLVHPPPPPLDMNIHKIDYQLYYVFLMGPALKHQFSNSWFENCQTASNGIIHFCEVWWSNVSALVQDTHNKKTSRCKDSCQGPASRGLLLVSSKLQPQPNPTICDVYPN